MGEATSEKPGAGLCCFGSRVSRIGPRVYRLRLLVRGSSAGTFDFLSQELQQVMAFDVSDIGIGGCLAVGFGPKTRRSNPISGSLKSTLSQFMLPTPVNEV